jgi:AcrR family transcriptional regulator
VSPKVADPEVREALIDAAASLLAHDGPRALSTRRLAAEVGASTMAVYTHFGGMDGLHREVRREGFSRLTGFFDTVQRTKDPVADLSALGWAYCFNAIANPQLYRAVFLEAPIDAEDQAVGRAAVQQPIDAARRCIEAGRFRPADPESLAIQLWAASHGTVTGWLAQLLTLDEVLEHLPPMGRNLFVGFGDDPVRAMRSIKRAQRRMVDRVPLSDWPAERAGIRDGSAGVEDAGDADRRQDARDR